MNFLEYEIVVQDLRATLRSRIENLRDAWTRADSEQSKSTFMWMVALATAAWDVSEGAMQLCAARQMRAARILDRPPRRKTFVAMRSPVPAGG